MPFEEKLHWDLDPQTGQVRRATYYWDTNLSEPGDSSNIRDKNMGGYPEDDAPPAESEG